MCTYVHTISHMDVFSSGSVPGSLYQHVTRFIAHEYLELSMNILLRDVTQTHKLSVRNKPGHIKDSSCLLALGLVITLIIFAVLIIFVVLKIFGRPGFLLGLCLLKFSH